MSICKYCRGTGRQDAGYNYLAHDCPDCYGTGEEIFAINCSGCGEEFLTASEDEVTCDECRELEEGEE